MKIFAKRTRTVVDAETAQQLLQEQEAAKEREADKVVQELLKLDPKELNAKQRRMVKRYKERGVSTGTEDQTTETVQQSASADDIKKNVSTESETQPLEEAQPVSLEETKIIEQNGEAQGVDESDQDDSSSSSDENEEEEDKAAAGEEDKAAVENKVDEETVKKLLEELNSKQRRKLMRRLEREGNDVIAEVHKEALLLMEENKAERALAAKSEEQTDKNQSEEGKAALTGKKRKKDWSNLTPEERMRREEQRRLQQEAAERRAKEGSGSGDKRHPLNSERRRANRRKPKWEGKQQARNDHDSSGYHMRKITAADR